MHVQKRRESEEDKHSHKGRDGGVDMHVQKRREVEADKHSHRHKEDRTRVSDTDRHRAPNRPSEKHRTAEKERERERPADNISRREKDARPRARETAVLNGVAKKNGGEGTSEEELARKVGGLCGCVGN